MRQAIKNTLSWPQWAQKDTRYQALHELDLYLDGEIYDHFQYMFYKENQANGTYIEITKRRPSVRFNLYAAVADMIAREVFAGYNAPTLQHKKENVRKAFDAVREETEILSHMIELTNWLTVGSSVATFKVVPFGEGKAKAVMNTYRAKQCTPFFNELKELSKLRVHYLVSGSQLLTQDIKFAFDNKPLKYDKTYWFVRDYGATLEQTYYPIPENKWKPADVNSRALIPIPAADHKTGLDFVPAHWFQRRTGKVRPHDGRCVWEHAIPMVIDFDYTMSQSGAGVRYNCTPQVAIKGQIANADDDGSVIGGPSRYLHLVADRKDEGGLQESGADAFLLEASGSGMAVGIEKYGKMLKDLAILVICSSRKDPDKITTAMSAKGMETLDKEYFNLIQEFRTVAGDNGYLKLLKKIGAACVVANHPLFEGISLEDVDGLTLKWPPINPVGAQEFLYLCQGAASILAGDEAPAETAPAAADGDSPATRVLAPVESKEPIMTREELRSYITGSIDASITSSNRDYLAIADGRVKDATDPAPITEEEKKNLGADGELLGFAEAAIRGSQREPLDTSFNLGEG